MIDSNESPQPALPSLTRSKSSRLVHSPGWEKLPTESGLPATVFKLDNGLTVIHQYLPDSSVAVVDVWVRAGAIAEPTEWSGMAHFLEHMIFKGTPTLAPGMFDWKIEAQGGVTNAATSHDYAHYFMTTAAPRFEDSLPYLAELLLHASIPDDEFLRERDVVLEEIRRSQDNPDWQAYQALLGLVYPQHPYGRPVLGTAEQLMARSPEEMRRFHHTYYQPETMTVVVVGGVEQHRVLSLVEEQFRHFAAPSRCVVSPRRLEPPLQERRCQVLELPRLEQARLMMAWVCPGVDHLDQAYGLDVISVLLATGRTSRLVQDLREDRGLVQGISSSLSLQQDSSLFTISAWLEPKQIERVEALISEHLATLQSTPISEAELRRCKRLLCNDYAFSTEAPQQLASLYGYYNTVAEVGMASTYPACIQCFEAKELQQLAQEYLSPQHYAATILKPA